MSSQGQNAVLQPSRSEGEAACGVERRIFRVEHLHCAQCAEKIEVAIRRMDGVEDASLDLMQGRLSVCTGRKEASFLDALNALASGIERGVEIKPMNEEKRFLKAGLKDGLLAHWRDLVRMGLSALTLIAAFALPIAERPQMILLILAYALVGTEVLVEAARGVLRGDAFNEQVLMTVASLGAFAIGAHEEAVAVMLFYQVGELAQTLAVERSRSSIGALMDIRPEAATLRQADGTTVEVAPEAVAVGDVILVRPGEKVPLDGTVIEGSAYMDTRALTGESVPRRWTVGDQALSGAVSTNGLLAIEVTARYVDSTVARILEMVEHAAGRKARTEQFVTRFARVYTPVVVFSALALAVLPPLFLPGAQFSDWIYRALVFLVCSCPCALVLSVPLSFFAGIGGASREAILVKGANYLEALARTDVLVFDKTGTLTEGVFRVDAVVPAAGVTDDEVLALAAAAEAHSNHPLAQSVAAAWQGPIAPAEGVEEIAGKGIRCQVGGETVLCGNRTLLAEAGIEAPSVHDAVTVIYLARGGVYVGHLTVADRIKSDSRDALQRLRRLRIGRTVMLTGDRAAVAEDFARQSGLDEVYSELLPGDKLTRLETIKKETRGVVAFVGDGLNDAPVLAGADVGIAMGALGADAAIEAADVVLMTDEPSKIATAIQIARKTRRICYENIVFAIGIKFFILLLAAVGMASMWAAVFADVGVALLAVLNAMRAMAVPK